MTVEKPYLITLLVIVEEKCVYFENKVIRLIKGCNQISTKVCKNKFLLQNDLVNKIQIFYLLLGLLGSRFFTLLIAASKIALFAMGAVTTFP